jgi:DNA recombination protein RmuC
VIVTPATLLACALLIACGQIKNNKKTHLKLRQAGALYDKFEGFVSDLIKIGKKIDEQNRDIVLL